MATLRLLQTSDLVEQRRPILSRFSLPSVVFQTLPQHIIHAGVVEIRHAQQDNSRTDISSRLNIGHIIWADSQSLRRLLLGHTSRPAECLNPFSDSFCINHHHTPFQVQCIV